MSIRPKNTCSVHTVAVCWYMWENPIGQMAWFPLSTDTLWFCGSEWCLISNGTLVFDCKKFLGRHMTPRSKRVNLLMCVHWTSSIRTINWFTARVLFSMGYGPRLLFGQWLNTPLASTCLLTSSPIWITGQYACGSRRNIEPLAKYLTMNYTAFGWNNMAKFFNYPILADIFVLNLKKWINPRCHFSYWYSIQRLVIRSWDFCQALWSISHTE